MSESSQSEDEEHKELYKNNPAARFLRVNTEKQKEKEKKNKREKDQREVKKQEINDEDGWQKIDSNGRPEVKLFADNEEITTESILNKLQTELEGKNSKKDQKKSQVDVLHKLIELVENKGFGIGLLVKIRVSLVSMLLQYKYSATYPCMALDNWKRYE